MPLNISIGLFAEKNATEYFNRLFCRKKCHGIFQSVFLQKKMPLNISVGFFAEKNATEYFNRLFGLFFRFIKK